MIPKITDNFGFYAILTNPVRGYEYVTQVLVDNQIPYIQLRIKEEPSTYKILQLAEKLRQITEKSPSKLIINDYPHIARDSGADGVHIGQDDIAYELAREVVGAEAIIGISTHNPGQTQTACKKQPDYIGIGPVYKTPTKKVADPVIGLKGMQEMLALASVPAVCIGGIALELIPEVLKYGARNFSLVRPLCQAEDPDAMVKKIIALQGMAKVDRGN